MSPDETMFEICGECYDCREVEQAAEEFLDELRGEVADLESELEDDEDADRTELDLLTADLEACEGHVW